MNFRVRKATEDHGAGVVSDRPTLVGSILESQYDAAKLHAKVESWISDEATTIVGAGTASTAWVLSVITFNLLSRPAVLTQLTEELRVAIQDPLDLPSWTTLEKLPYLSGVIQEGLRLSYGSPARSARVATEEDLVYIGEQDKKPIRYVIPRGYAVGMSAAILHHDESFFPDSYAFQPERWLVVAEHRKELDRAMLVFSKGSRMCLGMK